MQVISGKVKKPFNVLTYGPPGAGKSTWAQQSPSPIFIASDELDELDADRLPKVTSSKEVLDQMDWLLNTDHKYKTVVVDTIDAIEKIIHQEILKDEKSDKTRSMNKARGGYGNAYGVALDKLTGIRDKLAALREAKKMNVIILCHSTTRVTNDPLLGDSYTEYYLSLHEKAQSLFVDWVSAVLFLTFDVSKSDNEKFAFGSGERYLYTQKKPGFEAKNRYHLDPVLAAPEESSFATFWEGYNAYFGSATPKPKQIIMSIKGLLENVDDEKLIASVKDTVRANKTDPAKLMKVQTDLQTLIGG